MDQQKEISSLIEKIDPMLERFSELSKEEQHELGKMMNRLNKLNHQTLNEVVAESKQTKEKLDEYETTSAMMEAFILENGLYEQFLVFSNDLINDFMKNKKPNLTLVQ